MQAFAGNCLGLAVEAFWLLSLAQYIQRVQLHERTVRRGERHLELNAAQTTAMVANTGFRSFEQPREAREFMPSEWAKNGGAAPAKRLTRKQQQARDLFFLKRLVAYQNANVERGIA